MKVAKLMMEVSKAMGGKLSSEDVDYEAISRRIQALVDDGHLEAQGDIRKWRFSEIRRIDAGGTRN